MSHPSLIHIPIGQDVLFTSIQVNDLQNPPPHLLPTDYLITLQTNTFQCGFWVRIPPKSHNAYLWPIEPHPGLVQLIDIFKSYISVLRTDLQQLTILLDITTTNPIDYENYVDLGFGQPLLIDQEKNKTPQTIQLTSCPEQQARQGLKVQVLGKIEFMINSAFVLRHIPKRIKRFELDRNGLQELYSKLYDLKEWSCCWTKKGSNRLEILPSSWNSSLEDYDSAKQNEAESLTVDIFADTKYSCHTHPFIGYLVKGFMFSSPSKLDFVGCLRFYKSFRFHFVATMEGLYQIEYTPITRIYALFLEQFHPECFEIFAHLFGLYVNNPRMLSIQQSLQQLEQTEHLEQLELNIHFIRNLYQQGQFETHTLHRVRERNIQKYVDYINQCTFHTLLTFSPSKYHDLSSSDLRTLHTRRDQLQKCLRTFIETDFKQLNVCHFRFVTWNEIQTHPYLEAVDYKDIDYAPFMALKSG